MSLLPAKSSDNAPPDPQKLGSAKLVILLVRVWGRYLTCYLNLSVDPASMTYEASLKSLTTIGN